MYGYPGMKVRFDGLRLICLRVEISICGGGLACFCCLANKLAAWGRGFTAVVLERSRRIRRMVGEVGLHPPQDGCLRWRTRRCLGIRRNSDILTRV